VLGVSGFGARVDGMGTGQTESLVQNKTNLKHTPLLIFNEVFSQFKYFL